MGIIDTGIQEARHSGAPHDVGQVRVPVGIIDTGIQEALHSGALNAVR